MNKIEKDELVIQYAAKIQTAIGEMFEEDSTNYINPNELENSDKIKAFLHAMSTVVPCMLYCNLTGEEKNNLEYNHIANHLCFEYSNFEEK